MAPRFTVIQGGLSEQAEPAELRTGKVLSRAAGCRVDLRTFGGEDAVSAWTDLPVRNAVAEPLREPDHLPPQVQYRSLGQGGALTLAWNRAAGTERDAVQAAVPLAMPHPIRGGHAHLRQPAGVEVAGLVEQAAAEAVDRALKARLGALRRPIRLVGAVEPAWVSPRPRPARRAHRPAPPCPVPAVEFVGIRPAGWEAPAAEIRTGIGPEAMRAAVETGLVHDACTPARSITADSDEAAFVAAASRLFGRSKALRMKLLKRAGAIVAGAFHLGATAAAMPWRRARA